MFKLAYMCSLILTALLVLFNFTSTCSIFIQLIWKFVVRDCTELLDHIVRRSHSAVRAGATQKSIEAAPVPPEYRTVIFSVCVEFTSHYKLCATILKRFQLELYGIWNQAHITIKRYERVYNFGVMIYLVCMCSNSSYMLICLMNILFTTVCRQGEGSPWNWACRPASWEEWQGRWRSPPVVSSRSKFWRWCSSCETHRSPGSLQNPFLLV